MKDYILYIYLFLNATIVQAQQQDSTWQFFYKGKVDNQYSITMELNIIGTQCTGRYYYDKYRKDMLVRGIVMPNNTLLLEEINARGMPTQNRFKGKYAEGWMQIAGNWQDTSGSKEYSFYLNKIDLPMGQNEPLKFESIRQFQAMLNYFDVEIQLSLKCQSELKDTKIKWQKDSRKTETKDFKRFIPYQLAKRYVMRQVGFRAEGNLNYWDIKAMDYKPHEMCYRSIGTVIKTSTYVGLLLNFTDDNGWDQYDVTFLLVYDYGGRLLDACKVAKMLHLDQANLTLDEKMEATITRDMTVMVASEIEKVSFGKNEQGEEQFIRKKDSKQFHYVLQPTGKFFIQELSK